jgi:urea transporter/murein DD-endopeptidase MepM/ murein hydrolase activator NlpD
MLQNYLKKHSYLGKGILNAYSQVFFSDNPWFALLLIGATMLVPSSGLAGLAGVVISMILATWLGYDKALISKGILSYNVLLVTLPLGLYFKPGMVLILTIVFASILTFFLTVALRGWMQRYRLPFLSWPFLIGLWIVFLSVREFSSLELSDQVVYDWNRIFSMGGHPMIQGYQWISDLNIPGPVITYLTSLGAVFFQYSIIGGLLVAIGLLIASRISFVLSLIGFFSAYLFYGFIGLDLNSLNYTYIGFNYILMAIAVGGFFLVPSWSSYAWAIILVPLATFLSVSMNGLLGVFQLSAYALPFNVIVPLFLFVLQFRIRKPGNLREVVIQHNTPEKNLYAVANYQERLGRNTLHLFSLPFRSEWNVSQGHDGKETHRGEWRNAWDFVKRDSSGNTFRDQGFKLTDYYCYGKPVLAAGYGVVEHVSDGIPDNAPGDANTRNNWGNTVIIRHEYGLYSKYAHLKPGSLKVKLGEYVYQGQEIAQVGSSGRSPEPHLHFQFQSTPYIDSGTLDFPFAYYVLKSGNEYEFRSFDRPVLDEIVANPEVNPLLSSAFHMIPGQKIKVLCSGSTLKEERRWLVETDMYNQSSLVDPVTHSRAWFVNDGKVFYFTHYEGSRSDALYYFFLALFRVPLLFEPRISIRDSIPLFSSAKPWMRWLQDWVAPFRIFLKTSYTLRYTEIDQDMDPQWIGLSTAVIHEISGDPLDTTTSGIWIGTDGIMKIEHTGPRGTFNLLINSRCSEC